MRFGQTYINDHHAPIFIHVNGFFEYLPFFENVLEWNRFLECSKISFNSWFRTELTSHSYFMNVKICENRPGLVWVYLV